MPDQWPLTAHTESDIAASVHGARRLCGWRSERGQPVAAGALACARGGGRGAAWATGGPGRWWGSEGSRVGPPPPPPLPLSLRNARARRDSLHTVCRKLSDEGLYARTQTIVGGSGGRAFDRSMRLLTELRRNRVI